MNIKTVSDSRVHNIWKCTEKDCENEVETVITPDWYQDNGTPVCECDVDMEYIRTDIDLETEWTQEDILRSFRAGWGIFLVSNSADTSRNRKLEIQRIDESRAFENDEEALAYVKHEAEDPDIGFLERKALDRVKSYNESVKS